MSCTACTHPEPMLVCFPCVACVQELYHLNFDAALKEIEMSITRKSLAAIGVAQHMHRLHTRQGSVFAGCWHRSDPVSGRLDETFASWMMYAGLPASLHHRGSVSRPMSTLHDLLGDASLNWLRFREAGRSVGGMHAAAARHVS